jgi:tyrocidine synthetase-3
MPEGLELPCDKTRPAVRAPAYAKVTAPLGHAVAARLRRVPSNRSPFAWSFAATAVFFGKIANAKTFVVGLAVDSGVVPLRVTLDAKESFQNLLTRIETRMRDDAEHVVTDVDELVRRLDLPRDVARNALYDVGFGPGAPTADLHVRFQPEDVELTYDANLFTAPHAGRLVSALANVLRGIANVPEDPIGDLSLLSAADAAALLEELCAPAFNWPQHLLLHELFEARVDLAPNAIALSAGAVQYTYAELEAKANAVARALKAHGVGPDSIVALAIGRSPEMIVGILAALKAGGAYLPIEPDAPRDRIEYVLQDSAAKVLLTVADLRADLPTTAPVLCVDEVVDAAKNEPRAPRLPRACEPHHLAYVIYTSGSTGLPKGVLIEHRNVVHLILAEREDFGVRPNEALVLISSYTFDASIDQIWLALTSGAKLVLVDKTTILDAALLANVIKKEGVTHLDTIPSLLAGFSPDDLPSIKRVVVGGESCSVAVARAWSGAVRLYNEYGPTETTVGSLRHLVGPLADADSRVPIGKPIGLTRAYVLDWGGRLVPPGVRGELCIGGAGVTRGYLNRNELTRERFVPDPHAAPGARMYRTGDIVTWRADGTMDFFGRIDHQVKVRGFRIELGEIEAAVLKHAAVTDAAVTVVGDSDDTRQIVCHFQARGTLSGPDLARFLGESLPVYMLPTGILQMEELPKTVAGKVDKKKLPRIRLHAEGVEPPENRLEHEVREIWSALLRVPADQIGVTHGFFELGGHSLLVTQLALRIERRLGVALRVATILAAPTIRQIAEAIANEGPTQAPVAQANLGIALKATDVQRVMYVVQQGNPNNTSHNLPLLYEMSGDLPDAEIERAFAVLLERHEALRTGFFFQEGQILQKIAQNARVLVEHIDIGDDGLDETMAAFIRPFVLEEPPLVRVAKLYEGGEAKYLALDLHHMITDGMSIETMLEDLISIVENKPLPAPKLRYFDHAAWLESDAWRARVAAAKPYWMNLLRDDLPALDLPLDHPRPITGHARARDVTIEIGRDKLDAIARYARAHKATPFAFFAAVYSLFLSSKTGRSDVVFGFPSAGRPHPDFERVVGMFVNLLVFRANVTIDATFSTLVAETMRQVSESLKNEDYPFDSLVADLGALETPGRRPIIDTMLSYEGFTPGEYKVGGAVLHERRVGLREAQNDLAVVIREAAGGYTIWFEYSAALFDHLTIEAFAREFLGIIDKVLARDDVPVADLHTVAPAEEKLLVHRFNQTEHALPEVQGVHELFERHAREQPHAPCVTLRDATWSYAEVERRANAIAHALVARGQGASSIVGIVAEPSREMLTSILGVLKAGAAFMPIDASYPLARKLHMIEDSGTKVLLAKSHDMRELRERFKGDILDLGDPALAGSDDGVGVVVKRSDLAYVIYTSGSTGQPKGVMVEHGNLLNFASWIAETLGFKRGEAISKYASFGFDSSVGEIVPAFCAGAHLVVVPDEIRLSIDELDAYFAQHRVAVADLPTQFGEQFLKHATRHSLRIVRVGGEKLRTVPSSRAALMNEYGPTECTVVATSFLADKSYDNIPIGRPAWNTQVLILDRLGRLSPVGVPGELCIAGTSVARGYLNQPALTEDKFVKHPLARGGRIYRTGDLARWLADGNLEFLGRLDTQVKVRGFRIELGEVEQALMALSGITDAVVVARENPALRGDLALVAFVTGPNVSEEEQKAALARTLPPYMVPARIVRLDEIPLTANGKVDKRRLPAVEMNETTKLTAPRTPMERALRPLYAEILAVPEARISVDTNFVALGGHSLKAAMLLTAIYRQTGVQLRLAKFLEASTIEKVAESVEAQKASAEPTHAFAKVARDAVLPLTSSQSRILAVQQLASFSTAYNIPIAWELHGDVDLERLARALTFLPSRHDALRATFVANAEGVVEERFVPDARLTVGRATVSDANLDVTLERMVEPFDLERAPLMRATIVTTETRKVLALDLHHIIADGMSFPVLLRDLESIYEGRATERTGPNFADYVAWEQSDEAKAKRASEKTWWLEKFADPPNQLDLPYDHDRPAHPSFEGDQVALDIPEETSAALRELASTHGVTPLNPFMAAWGIVLSRLGNNPDLVIGVPTFGRHVAGTEDMVGMFVNTVPIRLKLTAEETFRDLAARLGRESAEAFDRQAYHLSDLVIDLGVVRVASRNPLFDVVMEWQEDDSDEQRSALGLSELPPPVSSAKFDLELNIDNGRDGRQRLVLGFATSLFSRATAERFLGHLRRILEQVAANPDLRVTDLRMLQTWEREMLLTDFNRDESLRRAGMPSSVRGPVSTRSPVSARPASKRPPPIASGSTLTELFDAHVQSAPDAVAVLDPSGAYTWDEVDRRASVLARALTAAGVRFDDIVGLAMSRSREILVAIMGVLKAGAAYLPMDPEAPEERARGMLQDAEARVVVTDGLAFDPGCAVIRVDASGVRSSGASVIDFAGEIPRDSHAKTKGAAYVIYTSGSTGKPKGVVVEHASAVNYSVTSARSFGMGATDAVLLFSSITFDASVEQIGLALASGARLVVVGRDQLLDLEAFESFIIDKEVTFLHAVPLFLSSFVPRRPEALKLKWVVSGADVCPIPVAERWSKHAAFFNEYGPTETTVAALRHLVTPSDLKGTRLPIGFPAAGAKIYILDWTGGLAPLGVAGEMFIGGPGVSRGYRNNPALTEEKFLANYYAPGERFYRTGDIARFRRDGSVEFLGRADNQIKIRGYRIELGEIEAALLRHAAVAEAAVVVAGDGVEKRLCAYVVAREKAEPREVRSFVARLLPSYMVPEAVVILDALPVTSSGKLDRKRLPAPVFENESNDDAPATDAEWKLTAIWSEVLRLPFARIPVERSFFELGGHSLLLMQVITRVQEVFSVRLAPTDIFERPTIRALAALIGTRERNAIVRIPKLAETGRYPLSSVQRRLFAIQATNPESVSYNIPFVFEVAGHISRERLEEAVRAIVKRHASLRMSFVTEHGQPVAVIAPEVDFSLDEFCSNEPIEAITDLLVRPFDLAAAPLFRVVLVSRSNGDEVLFVDFHHIVVDGASTSILFREVREYLAGQILPPLRIHYGDFSAWQQTPEHQASLAEQRQFWLDRYKTLPPPLALPYDFRRPAARTYAGDTVSTQLDKEELEALQALSRGQDATLFVTLVSAYFLFLSRIAQSRDLVVGVPTSGRVHPDLEGLVGMFVNTVPWRLSIPTEGSFLDFLATSKALSIDFLTREEYQLEALLDDLGVRAEPGHNPLFDVMFSYLQGDADAFQAGNVILRERDLGNRTAKMDLTLTATESESGLDLTFEYATELFERATVERLAGHFATLLRSILRAPSQPLSKIEILTPAERTTLLSTFNDTARKLPDVAGIHELFEGWVKKTPDAEAVVCGPVRFSYAEVERRAEHVAAWLEKNDVKKGDRVAVILEPCADQLHAILGIFKAGAVFVPIDASYPVGRKAFIISDSEARALFELGGADAELEFKGSRLDLAKLPDGPAPARAKSERSANDAAYVIYTSGSTGKPKGVLVEHGCLTNFSCWYASVFGIEPGDGVSKYFGFAFDGSMAEVYPACISGARLVVVPAELRLNPKLLGDYLAEHRVAIAGFPTQFGEQFLGLTSYRGLRRVMLGGEKLRTHRPGPWTVVNGYGPTETTCLCTSYPVPGQVENIPIGAPVWNTQIYVLDDQDRICPIGVAGELCIAGAGVARGYLNRPELDAERFVENPFAAGPHDKRMYRSGDIARWLPDGNLEHLGRADTQVKLRGFRIELGEIEAALMDIAEVSDACVVDRKDAVGATTLVAYVVSSAPLDVPQLQKALARSLPDYMVPDHYHALDALPLTTNGKVDRRALPAVELGGGGDVEAAATDMEKRLLTLWSRILDIEPAKLSVTARFTDLGGHSLRAIALMTEIYRELAVELTVSDVFAHPTIRSMAVELTRRGAKADATSVQSARIPRNEGRDRFPLSSVQRRLFAMHQANPTSVSYNIPSVFEVQGNIARARLAAVMNAMVQRHASFRTSFAVEQGEPVARVSAHAPMPFAEIESDESIDELTARLVQPFDLSVAPLARVTLVRRSNGREVLLVDVHHIISDGTSQGILWRDVRSWLGGAPLPELAIEYGDFALWQARPERGTALAEHRKFWLERFATLPPALPLPYDFRRPATRTHAGDMVSVWLSKEERDALFALSREQGTTPFVTIISTFILFLSRISGVHDIVVGVPTAGRAHPDLKELVGMFVNTVPWRLSVPEEGTFTEFLSTAKGLSLEFLSREDYQLETLIEELGVRAEADHNPLFDVMFAYQFGEADSFQAGQVTLHGRDFGQRTAKMDLMLTASETDDGLELTFEFASELFERATIERLAAGFAALQKSVLRDPRAQIASLELLGDSERKTLLDTFNATSRTLPDVDGVHRLFEGWVARTPDAEAVRCRDVAYSYAEVERRAEIIAAWLQELGVQPDDRVALVLDPCADQMPAVLGVLKSGAAFVPIDASYPVGRQSYMIADAEARALITRGTLADGLVFTGPRLDVDALPQGPAPKREHAQCSLGNAAYVIYTSGSTGKPKGVVVEHKSLLNLALWSVDDNSVKAGDALSRYFGFSFDPTMSEVFPACMTGARLVVVPGELRLDPKGLSAYLAENRVNIAAFPTQFGEQFLLLTDNPGLRRVTLCGEKLRAYREGPWTLVNGYGPTETTCYSSFFVVDRQYENIPIGKPLWNTQILILDKRGRLCPIGVPGELCIGGTGVARGYLNKPELTREKFVPHPFDPTSRMYRTGDLARWLPDGNIEYLGRGDAQVKVRGYRVELGEIEAALLALPDIENASVIDVQEKSGVTTLVAYVVSKTPIDVPKIQKALAGSLPEFIVPSHFMQLDALPLTPNGKVDRRALPAMEIGDGAAVEPPATEMESTLVAIWARVLGADRQKLGVTTHFVDLGGHSLKAISLVTEIYRELGIELKVGDIFRTPTVRALAAAISGLAPTVPLAAIERATPTESYPASSVHERMFFLQELDKSAVTYNMPSLWAAAPSVKKADVARALAAIVDRHGAFRTSFSLVGSSPRLRTVSSVEMPLQEVKTTEAALERTVDELVRPFDMSKAPLARAAWIETEKGSYLFFDMHHAVCDGASIQFFRDELAALLRGEKLPDAPRDLVDCAVWERSEAGAEILRKHKEHWQRIFANGVPALEIITDFARPAVASHEGETITLDVEEETLRALRALGKKNGLSLYNLCLSAFNVFLSRLTRQEEVVVGTPVAGRFHPDMQRVYGMFVNTLVFENRVDPALPFLDFAREVTKKSLDALENQAFPFADLVEMAGAERRADRNPLFDVMIAVNELEDSASGEADLFMPVAHDNRIAKFDLTLAIDEAPDRLVLAMEYRTSLFRRATIECFLRSLRTLLRDLTQRPTAALASLSILDSEDRRRVEKDFNDTAADFPKEPSAVTMFEAAAARTPAARALVDGAVTYTYEEADAAANRLAHRLIGLGVGRESVVAILSKPCAEMFIAELAVLKAGAAFLPLDHRYPTDRLEYMLRDSGARVLLAGRGLDAELEWPGARMVLGKQLFAEGTASRPEIEQRDTDLAYVIYTSGSTGRPKGVAVEHRSFVALVHRMTRHYEIRPGDRHGKYAGVGFDASIMEVFPALCNGAELHVVPEEIRLSPPDLASWIERSGITWAFLPPQIGEELMLVQKSPAGDHEARKTSLRNLCLGGDRLRRFVPASFAVTNEYGPTEFTVSATSYVVREASPNIPIGKPNANCKVFILDARGELSPPFVPGEICLTGVGLARGYVGAPELTAKKFVEHPLAQGGRIYRTGDLARWREDGNIEFLGRIDAQVKIRGYRIELGEIEQAVLEVDGISDCVVVTWPDPQEELSLAAYFIATASLEASHIRESLKKRLPDFMVPQAIMQVTEIPFTTSGKVDKKRLPAPVLARRERTVTPAENVPQGLVIAAFESVLNQTGIGIDDDFFELGGNSIKAIAAVAALANDFRITANDLFRLRTARAVARDVPLARGDLAGKLHALADNLRADDAAPPSSDDAEPREIQQALAAYRARWRDMPAALPPHRETFRNVLLTGATGFLGAFLLRDLLRRTDAKIFVALRAGSRKEAWDRVTSRAAYYFGEGVLEYVRRRIIVVPSNLAEPRLGLDEGTWANLGKTIDCIVHSAALTKHYGDYSTFVASNIDATQHLIDLAKVAACPINLVSTMSVAAGPIAGREHALFTEYDADIGQKSDNHYVHTKLEAEKAAIRARQEGLVANIFRVGFLTGDSRTHRFQQNADDSGFVQKLRSYVALGALPQSALVHSFCPVDEVSDAIMRLLQASALRNETHHIDRFTTPADAQRFLAQMPELKALGDAAFYAWLADNLGESRVAKAATAMLLHEGLLDQATGDVTETVTVRERTQALLAKLGFEWSEIAPEQVWSLLDPNDDPLPRPSIRTVQAAVGRSAAELRA